MPETERITYALRLVCTGHTRHMPSALASVRWFDDGARQIGTGIIDHPDWDAADPIVGNWGQVLSGTVIPPSPSAPVGSGASRESYRFRCRSKGCSQNTHINANTFWAVLETARRSDMRQVDVSLLVSSSRRSG
jgi:hypothetical protein